MEPLETISEEPKHKGLATAAIAAMAFTIAALLFVADRPAHAPVPLGTVKAAKALSRPLNPAGNWTYSSATVELTGEKQESACTTSSEGARLCFRKTGTRLESYLASPSDDQQFLCTRSHCTTQIKIDNQPVFSSVGSDSPDGNIAMVYLGQPQQLLALLKNATQAELGPPMYEQDGLVLHFHVSGLNDFGGNPSPNNTAAVGSHTTHHLDPRLTAPIEPIFPPAPRTQIDPPSMKLRFSVA